MFITDSHALHYPCLCPDVAFRASFVSHTWARDRRDPMFRSSTEFTGFKAAELKEVLEDIAAEKRAVKRSKSSYSRLDEMLMKVPTAPLDLWIDKVCWARWCFFQWQRVCRLFTLVWYQFAPTWWGTGFVDSLKRVRSRFLGCTVSLQ